MRRLALESAQQQIADTVETIKAAAATGALSIQVNSLTEAALQYLAEQGYQVSIRTGIGTRRTTTISW